jgi:hypothetical protein
MIALNCLISKGFESPDILRVRQHTFMISVFLGAERIPDLTTAGDFCRRFDVSPIDVLHRADDQTRLRVWGRQPAGFFTHAKIDADGTILLRGNTDFTRVTYPDRWHEMGDVTFIFGMDVTQRRLGLLDKLDQSAWAAVYREKNCRSHSRYVYVR